MLVSTGGGAAVRAAPAGGRWRRRSSAITAWVKAHGTAVTGLTVSGGTLYKVG